MAVSAIANPVNCPWRQKACSAYLGKDTATWADYDATLLMLCAAGCGPAIVDHGEADDFLEKQLKLETLKAAAKTSGDPLGNNRREGDDQSCHVITCYIKDHLRFHARHLSA